MRKGSIYGGNDLIGKSGKIKSEYLIGNNEINVKVGIDKTEVGEFYNVSGGSIGNLEEKLALVNAWISPEDQGNNKIEFIAENVFVHVYYIGSSLIWRAYKIEDIDITEISSGSHEISSWYSGKNYNITLKKSPYADVVVGIVHTDADSSRQNYLIFRYTSSNNYVSFYEGYLNSVKPRRSVHVDIAFVDSRKFIVAWNESGNTTAFTIYELNSATSPTTVTRGLSTTPSGSLNLYSTNKACVLLETNQGCVVYIQKNSTYTDLSVIVIKPGATISDALEFPSMNVRSNFYSANYMSSIWHTQYKVDENTSLVYHSSGNGFGVKIDGDITGANGVDNIKMVYDTSNNYVGSSTFIIFKLDGQMYSIAQNSMKKIDVDSTGKLTITVADKNFPSEFRVYGCEEQTSFITRTDGSVLVASKRRIFEFAKAKDYANSYIATQRKKRDEDCFLTKIGKGNCYITNRDLSRLIVGDYCFISATDDSISNVKRTHLDGCLGVYQGNGVFKMSERTNEVKLFIASKSLKYQQITELEMDIGSYVPDILINVQNSTYDTYINASTNKLESKWFYNDAGSIHQPDFVDEHDNYEIGYAYAFYIHKNKLRVEYRHPSVGDLSYTATSTRQGTMEV